MSELRPIETRRRSRSKTPFLRSSCDHENCEHTDEEDYHHHNKKTVTTASAPKVQTITEETVEVTSSSAVSSNAKEANQKVKTSDYSSDDTSPDFSKIKSRAVIESHEKQINTATYITTTTTTTSSSSGTFITKSSKAVSDENSVTAATSTPKANSAVNSFAAQFATSPADILNASKGVHLAQGRREQAEATQNDINAAFEHSQQRNYMAARVNKSGNDSRHRSQNNVSNSSRIRSIRRFLSNSFGGGGGGSESEGEEHSYNAGSLSDHIAYREYKRAGEYWKTTPKTDYTYSKLSPHRRVLAPGVVAMPNMSRRSLENHHERINYLIEHNPTKESYIRLRYESPKYALNRRRETEKLVYDSGDEVDLINFKSFGIEATKQSKESWFMRGITSVVTVFTNIWRAIYGGVASPNESGFYRTKIINEKRGFFGSVAHGFRSAVYNFFRYIYLFISYVLCVDTWLLRSPNAESRSKKRFLLFLLFLLPLLLLTGLYYYLHPNESFPPSSFSQHIETFVMPQIDLSDLINPAKYETFKAVAFDRFEDFRDWTDDYLSYLRTVSQNIAEEGRKFFRREEFYTRI